MVKKQFFQAAWIVDDIDASMREWVAGGVGPFYVMRHPTVDDIRYRGQPSSLNYSAALAQSGPMQIELIQQHDDLPSPYRDSYGKGQSGFHHICCIVEDFDAEVAAHARLGIELAGSGRARDMRFGYLDSRQVRSCMTEIIEDRPWIRELFATVTAGSIGWDGRNPIREM